MGRTILRGLVLAVVGSALAWLLWFDTAGDLVDVELPQPAAESVTDLSLITWQPGLMAPAAPPGWHAVAAKPLATGVVVKAAMASELPPDWGTLGLPRVSWSGTVNDQIGDPVAGAQVWIIPNGRTRSVAGLPPQPYAAFVGLGPEQPRQLSDAPLSVMPHTVTDEFGRFGLDVPHLPMHLVKGEHAFGLPDPVLVVSAPGQATVTLRMESPLSGEARSPSIRLVREVVMVGQVLDGRGAAVVGAKVAVIGLGRLISERGAGMLPADIFAMATVLLPGLHETVTDGEGRFRLDGLWPSRVTLAISAAGFGRSIERDIVATAGRVNTVPEIVMAEGGRVSGRIVDPQGMPVAGVEVIATTYELNYGGRGCIGVALGDEHDRLPVELDVSNRPETLSTQADRAGRFEFDALPRRPLTLYARGLGWEPARRRAVMAGDDELLLQLQPSARIVVEILAEEDRSPVFDAWVMARRLTGTGNDPALTVLAGDDPARLIVDGVGLLGTAVDVFAPGRAALRVELPGLLPGTEASTTLLLPRASRISGVVQDERGRLLADVHVTLAPKWVPGKRPLTPLGLSSIPTDAEGRFRFEGLPGDSYTLSPRRTDARLLTGKSLEVGLTSNQCRDDLVLTVVDAASVEVTVWDPLGDPLQGVLVAAFLPGAWEPGLGADEFVRRSESVAWSDTAGRAVLTDLGFGAYDIVGGALLPERVSLVPGDMLEMELAVPALIGGRVTVDGVPVEGVRLGVPFWREFARTDGDGRYTIAVTRVGKVTVRLMDYERQDALVWSVDVDAQAGATLDIDLGGFTLRGVVKMVTGERVAAGIAVALYDTSGEPRRLGWRTTDERGEFEFPFVDEGNYTVTLAATERDRWYPEQQPTWTLPEDWDHSATLVISAGATIEGLVVGVDGNPVRDGYRVLVWQAGALSPQGLLRTRSGSFRVEGLGPGAYQLAVLSPGSGNRPDDPTSGKVVLVSANDTLQVELLAEQ